MDDDDSFGIFCYGSFDQAWIDIEIYGLAIDKLYRCSGIFNGIGRCDHGERGHDHFIARTEMPSAARTRCSATVPFAQATAYSQPASRAKARSNLSTKGPLDEIQFEFDALVQVHALVAGETGLSDGIGFPPSRTTSAQAQ